MKDRKRGEGGRPMLAPLDPSLLLSHYFIDLKFIQVVLITRGSVGLI